MKHDTPFFSIIIPTFNRAQSIGKTIDSIRSQAFKSMEIIIVDDGSTDNTSEVIAAIKDDRISYSKIINSERGAARNHGLKQATGNYVNFFDSDDLFLPCLENLKTFIANKDNPDVIYGGIQHRESSGKEILIQSPPYNSFTKNLFHNNFLACGAVFLKREIALQLPFHEDRRLSSAEDWELWLRVHSKFSFTWFPNLIFQQLHHSDRSLVKITAEKIEIRDTYFATLVLNNDLLKNAFGRRAINLFVADRFTFIALAWLSTNRAKAFSNLVKALQTSFWVIQRKRFWAILKKLALG
jgi:glycosyltransferase involved in cell wall biosynthesis